ncbi:hypothetical protein TNCV_1543121 [Trichonephila clavipes]|nr:hypothetical protein TNCV_1543121 [Trichonephila clavipes]
MFNDTFDELKLSELPSSRVSNYADFVGCKGELEEAIDLFFALPSYTVDSVIDPGDRADKEFSIESGIVYLSIRNLALVEAWSVEDLVCVMSANLEFSVNNYLLLKSSGGQPQMSWRSISRSRSTQCPPRAYGPHFSVLTLFK